MHKSWMWKQRSFREQFQGDEGNGGAGGAGEAQQQDESQDQADEQTEDETSEGEPEAGQGDEQGADDGELVITLGDEAPASEDPEEEIPPAQRAAWARMRKTERELKQKVREYEQAEAARQAAAAPKAEDVGDKPTLESCDFDAEAYGEKLLAWNDRKQKADAKAAAVRKEQEATQAEWNERVTSYHSAKATLKVADFEAAEHAAFQVLDQTQQGIILHGCKTPEQAAKLIYALGHNQGELKRLAAIKNPVQYAFAAAELVTKMKEIPRKAPPPPERQVRGTAGGGTAVDSTEARLEREADESGNRTALLRYRKDKAARAAKAA